MNMSPSQGAAFATELKNSLTQVDSNVTVVVAPPFITIPAVVQAVKGSNIFVASQNMSDQESGAFTGEISPDFLLDAGVTYVILGHSERRALYNESDAFINGKVHLALKKGLKVILCVGETLEERESGQLETVLERQVVEGLKGVSEDSMKEVIIAYEPVWAIGTGKTATGDDANNAHAFIRSLVKKVMNESVANSLIIQYGGSVKPSNVASLMAMEHIDGALVGGASLSVELFKPIVQYND